MINYNIGNIHANIKADAIGIAIGNFDGVHKGHQELLENFVSACEKRDIEPYVLTFNPHPYLYFNPKNTHFLIDSYVNKIKKIKLCKVKEVIEIPFNESIQKISAESFIEDILLELKNLKLIYLGHDFKLGKGKVDSKKILKEKILDKQIEILEEKPMLFNDKIISSSIIRNLIKTDIDEVANYLGENFRLVGEVVSGKGVGTKSLVATANIRPNIDQTYPSLGVYLTRVKLNDTVFDAITNVGKNPTMDSDDNITIESHIFNFSKNIYNETIELEFIKKIREEKKFDDVTSLKEQIGKDIESAIKFYRETSQYRFALIGKDISHSKSQVIYEKLLQRFVNYTLIDCPDDNSIPSVKELFKKYQGVSITSPYKTHFLEKTVKNPIELFAVNALKRDDGKFYSTNTDYLGVKEIIKRYHKNGVDEFHLLGDGVMSKLTQLVLDELGVKYQVYSRKNAKIDKIDTVIKGKNKNCLIINCCAREYKFPLPDNSSFRFWDMNYSHEYHEKLFADASVDYSDGLELLELQAKYALSFWNLKSN